MTNTEQKKITNEKPISLAGVDFKKLMAAFLKVKPDEEKETKGDKQKSNSK